MFDKQYRFRGRHAVRVDKLTGVFDTNSKAKLFERNVDVYANAPLIGFLYGRTADIDDEKNPETNQVYNQNVMGDRVIYSQVWGDRIFEKCGIGRDERGDGGKTLEIRGKRRLSARDGGANYQQS